MIAGRVLPWKRFWAKRDGEFTVTTRGYLLDPDESHGPILNPGALAFQAVQHIPCLILLGEVGMGKTTALKSIVEDVRSSIAGTSTVILERSLSSCSTDYSLIEDVFRSREFSDWQSGSHKLILLLDALDEAVGRIDAAAGVIETQLSRCQQHLSRLSLRIACRSADWPTALENALRSLFGSQNCDVRELCPLREADIQLAATESSVDPARFLGEVEDRDVVPFAVRPVTLEFLLARFKKDGTLPNSQTQLYQEGCERLCEEVNPSHLSPALVGKLTSRQRLAIAARIAGVMLLSNRLTVALQIDPGGQRGDQVTLNDLVGGSERSDGAEFDAMKDSVLEALSTGLFSSRGTGLLAWSHKSYAEYLAAFYLSSRQLPKEQVRSLLLTSVTGSPRVVPQLREVAGWFASAHDWFFRELLACDPEILLLADLQVSAVDDRANLVGKLLNAVRDGVTHDRDQATRHAFRKLKGPHLAGLLRPCIRNRAESGSVRNVAVDIAEACAERDVQDELVAIALSGEELLRLRVNAAWAIVRIGDDAHLANLKPLVSSGDADEDDDLKGCGLLATWPTHLSFDELIAALTPPRRKSFVGAYQHFLVSALVQRMPSTVLARVLEWLRVREEEEEESYWSVRLTEALIEKAWGHLESEGVAKALAELVVLRASRLQSVIPDQDKDFNERITRERDRRHALLLEIVPLLVGATPQGLVVLRISDRFASVEDGAWICEKAGEESLPERRAIWALLIKRVADLRNPVIQQKLRSLIDTNEFYASQLRASLDRELAQVAGQAESSAYVPSTPEGDSGHEGEGEDVPTVQEMRARIEGELASAERGELHAWWKLQRVVAVNPANGRLDDEFETDLTKMLGWQLLGGAPIERLLPIAKTYLRDMSPEEGRWLGTDTIYFPAVTGYRSLRLLWTYDRSALDQIEPAQWDKWAAIIIAIRGQRDREDDVVHRELIRRAYSFSGDRVLMVLEALILHDNQRFDHVFAHNLVEHIWDDRIATKLLTIVKTRELKVGCWGDLMEALVERQHVDALQYAHDLSRSTIAGEADLEEKRVIAAALLVVHSGGAWWSTLWPHIRDQVSFARLAFERAAERIDRRRLIAKWIPELTEDRIGDLYVWLRRQYPIRDWTRDGVGTWGGDPVESIEHLCSGLINYLKDRGTAQACEALRCILAALPDYGWVKSVLVDAFVAWRRRAWMPLQPMHLRTLVADSDRRLVRNGQDLLAVLLESFQRLEGVLQGETPGAIDLWNETRDGQYYPPNLTEMS